MILACHNIEKAFGEREIVRDGSFHIEDREKAALVGVNGAGKSTILKMIIGEEPSDGGEIILAKGRSIGYLAQHQNLIPNGTIYEELRSAKADIIEMEQQLRSIEHELQSLSGEELNARLETYNRLQSQFESQNGYACESEIIGVLKGLGFTEEEFVYFVHSFYVPVCEFTAAETDYIHPFSAALHKDNYYATQFHPEKSGGTGEKILRNFLDKK